MSIFRCKVCDIEFDSDYHEILYINDLEVCEECYLDEIERNKK